MITRTFQAAASAAVFALATAFAPAAVAACRECGTVTDVRTFKKEGEASGAGAVIGGVMGGVLGHQVGSGRGNDVATIAGAGAGAYAGHQIEKNRNATTTYVVVVRMEDGATRSFHFGGPSGYRVGDRVKIVNKKLTHR
jgi:outer membrane lipoprotein SlyB